MLRVGNENSLHWFQVLFGAAVIWFSAQKGELRMRGGEPFPNQRFIRTSFLVIGAALLIGGIWGLFLARQ